MRRERETVAKEDVWSDRDGVIGRREIEEWCYRRRYLKGWIK